MVLENGLRGKEILKVADDALYATIKEGWKSVKATMNKDADNLSTLRRLSLHE